MYGILQNVVNDDVVVVTIKKYLALSDFQSTPNNVIQLKHPRFMPTLQFFERWWKYKNGDRVHNLCLHLPRTLNVDIENHILSNIDLFLNKCLRDAVQLTIELGPFQEITMLDHA